MNSSELPAVAAGAVLNISGVNVDTDQVRLASPTGLHPAKVSTQLRSLTALQTQVDDETQQRRVPTTLQVNKLALKKLNSPSNRRPPFKPKPITLENFTTEDIVNVASGRFKNKLAGEREAPQKVYGGLSAGANLAIHVVGDV